VDDQATPSARKPLTTTHPHGYLLVRPDHALGLVRISKNASTESKVRLGCSQWVEFSRFDAPGVAFVREPVARFLSSLPETVLRMTHFVVADPSRGDQVIVPQDVYQELAQAARSPVTDFANLFLELVEYAFFDAHHEPQVSFLADRAMRLRIDPRLYPTEHFERSIEQIERWTGITAAPRASRSNQGGAKPLSGRTPLVNLARRVSGTGVYRTVRHSGLLGLRYAGSEGPLPLRSLNAFANRFSAEMKDATFTEDFRQRVLNLYALDLELWRLVEKAGGDVPASSAWPG
jgi:hypothetical protein